MSWKWNLLPLFSCVLLMVAVLITPPQAPWLVALSGINVGLWTCETVNDWQKERRR